MSILTGEWWRPYLAGYAERGYSGAKALAELRESGPVARTKTFYDAWREEVGYEKGTWLASRQPLDKKLPESAFILSESHIAHPYTYIFTVLEYDADTGTYRQNKRAIGTNEMVTIAEAKAKLQSRIAESETRSGGVEVVQLFQGVFKSYLMED